MGAIEISPLARDNKRGAAAFRDGRRVGLLLGSTGSDVTRGGLYAWVGIEDHALARGEDPSLYADLYAAAGERWVEQGHVHHFVVVPADEAVLGVFFAVGFGQEQVHGERATLSERTSAVPPSVTVRRGGIDDLDAALALSGLIREHQMGPPVWSGLAMPAPERMREDWREALEDDSSLYILAERGGEAVGHALLYLAEDGTAELAVAATRPDVRGSGIGVVLTEHALYAAHQLGSRRCQTDWRATNLLSSRFWPRRGFRPFMFRLRRDVQPYPDRRSQS